MAVELPDLDRLRAREHAAFAEVVERHYVPLRRYLTRLVHDGELAADLTQETFLRAYVALPRLEDDSDVQGWLYRIATNLARQHHRHAQLVGWSSLETLDSARPAAAGWALAASGNGVEDNVAGQEVVQRALAQLSFDQQVCLLLYAWTGYTCAEIGQITGRSTDAVRMLLVRARRRFRSAYASEHDGQASTLWQDGEAGEMPGDDATPPGGQGSKPQGSSQGGAGAARRADRGDYVARTGTVNRTEGVPDACGLSDEALSFYPRGDMTRETFSALTEHLRECLRCRAALQDVQATYRTMQRHLCTAYSAPGGAAAAGILARVKAMALERVAVPEPSKPAREAIEASLLLPVPVPIPVRPALPRRSPLS